MEEIKVLFVEDDIELGKIVILTLNQAGYKSYYQTSLAAIQSAIREIRPDIIILNVEIGEKNSIDITPEIKIIAPKTPILFVSSHADSENVARALDAGGIACLKKPFEIKELLAYINRHATPSFSENIPIGNLSFNPAENLLTENGRPVRKLTVLECKLLKYLILNKNRTVSRRELESELWGKANENGQSLNNHIAKLRRFLASEKEVKLLTIPKTGYKLI